jgi:ATP-dependent Lon protease
VKEKVLAAHRAGIRTILLPQRNKLDLDEVPASALEGKHPITFHFVKDMSEVLDLALLPEKKRKRPVKPNLAEVAVN